MGSSDERKTPRHHERSNAEQNKNRSAAPRRGSQWQCRRQCHCYGISAAGPLRLAAPVRRGRSRGLALDQATLARRRLSLGRGRTDSAEAEDRPNGFHEDRTASDRPSTTTTWSTPPSVRSTASISCSPMQSLRDPTRVCAGRAAVILASGPPPRSCRPDYAHPHSRSGRRSPTTGSADADTAGGIEATAREPCSSLTSTVRDRSPQHEQDLLPDRPASSVPLGGPHSQATPVPPTDVFSPGIIVRQRLSRNGDRQPNYVLHTRTTTRIGRETTGCTHCRRK